MRYRAMIFSCALCACVTDPPGDLSPPAAATSPEASGDVGAAGGVVAGPAGIELAEASVEIPPGVVEGEATITLRAVFDGTPLPAGVERVGHQLELESSAPLKAPVRLTLPYEVGMARRAGHPDSATIRAWAGEGQTWRELEPVATREGAIVVSLTVDGRTVIAAGAHVPALEPTCTACAPMATLRDPQLCRPERLCLEDAPEAATLEAIYGAESPAALIGFLTPAGDTLRAEGFAPGAAARLRGGELAPQTSLLLNPSLDADGVLRVGLGSRGSARVSLRDPQPARIVAGTGLGAVMLGDGRALFMEVGERGVKLITDGADNAVINLEHDPLFAPSASAPPTLRANPTDPAGAFVLSGEALYVFSLEEGATTTRLIRTRSVEGSAPHAPLAIGASQGAALVATVNQAGQAQTFHIKPSGASTARLIRPSFPVRDVAFVGATLVLSSATTPELVTVNLATDGPQSVVRPFMLVDEGADSAARQAAMPRQFLRAADRLYVRLGDGRLLRVVPIGG